MPVELLSSPVESPTSLPRRGGDSRRSDRLDPARATELRRAPGSGRRPLIGVITNPNSKKNRKNVDRVRQLQEIVGSLGVVRQTASVAAIPEVINEFLDLGVDYWVSDGGDGALFWMLNTAHEVIARRLDDGENFHRHIRYALPTNGGTIDYVARQAGVRGKAEDILRKLVEIHANGGEVEESIIQSLHFDCLIEANGKREWIERHGFATAIAGVGNRFFSKYYLAQVPGPSTIVEVVSKASLSFLVGQTPLARVLPQSWLDYGEAVLRPHQARVTVDGVLLPYEQHTTIAVGAFKINLGGVFKMFPFASPDGTLHVIAGSPTPASIIANLPRMARGLGLEAKNLFDAPGRIIKVEATGGELLRPNIDGEFVNDVRELVVRAGPKIRIARVDAKS